MEKGKKREKVSEIQREKGMMEREKQRVDRKREIEREWVEKCKRMRKARDVRALPHFEMTKVTCVVN